MSNLEIRSVLVLSTVHLTKETCLGFKAWPYIAEYDEGCYFYAGAGEDPPSYMFMDAPEDLRIVLEFARRHGCIEVKFDRDADVVEALPIYDWDTNPAVGQDTLRGCLVQDLKEGMLVDLTSCPFLKDHSSAKFAYGQVSYVEQETAECITVGYEGIDDIGYPLNTVLLVKCDK